MSTGSPSSEEAAHLAFLAQVEQHLQITGIAWQLVEYPILLDRMLAPYVILRIP